MTVVAFAARPHPTANQPKKDLYQVGEIPPIAQTMPAASEPAM